MTPKSAMATPPMTAVGIELMNAAMVPMKPRTTASAAAPMTQTLKMRVIASTPTFSP